MRRGSYILLLNNDTIVTPGWLGRMLDIFTHHPETGIVGPMSNYVSGPQLVSAVEYKRNEEIDAFAERWTREHTGQSFPIYRVVGFCLLMKREVTDRIGGLDEQFGSGNFEDDDFCLRAALSGYQARVAQDVFIHHTGSRTFKSAGIDYNKSLLRNWELFKAKWGIPLDTPFEKGYQLPRQVPSHVSLAVPLPNVSSDHESDAENRWWEDVSVRREKKHKVTDINEAMQSAFEYHQAGDLHQAGNIYREILKSYPNSVEVLHYLGILHYQLGNYEFAIEYLEKALGLNPDDPSAYYNLGLTYKEKGQLDQAIACYEKALQLNPHSAKTHYNLGTALQEKGDHDEAIIHYQKALQLDANLSGVYYNLGIISQDKGHFDEAISHYQKALQLNPNLTDAYNNLGLSLREKGLVDDAITCYHKALQLNPTYADAYSNLGNALREKGLADDAIACYRKAIELNPNHATTYNNLGNAFQDKKQLDNVLVCFQKALALNPSFAEAYCNIVYHYHQTCDWEELGDMIAKLDGLTRKALNAGTKPAESPFQNITRSPDLSMNLAVAQVMESGYCQSYV